MRAVYYGMYRRQLRIVIDIVFPPTEHGKLLRDYNQERFTELLYPQPVGQNIALAKYSMPVIQAAIAACKFERNHYAAVLLAHILERWLQSNQTSGNTLLIPIPLSLQRQKERGFNQVTRVLSYLPRTKQSKIEKRLLIRTVDTDRQTSLGRALRLTNISGAFTITPNTLTYDWTGISRVIICDDVVTTGTTLAVARETLAPHLPPHVELVTLAWAH